HGDLYARHLLVDDAGALSGVIDWGDVHLGLPWLDLSIAFGFLPPSARAAFFETYGGVPDRALVRRARLRALGYAVALLVYGAETSDVDLVREARVSLDHLGMS